MDTTGATEDTGTAVELSDEAADRAVRVAGATAAPPAEATGAMVGWTVWVTGATAAPAVEARAVAVVWTGWVAGEAADCVLCVLGARPPAGTETAAAGGAACVVELVG